LQEDFSLKLYVFFTVNFNLQVLGFGTVINCGDYKKELEDTKGVIRICKSKDRQHNGQKSKDKRINNDLQNITYKTKD
jgi:hypothetical protein